jgi:hypothetical protein
MWVDIEAGEISFRDFKRLVSCAHCRVLFLLPVSRMQRNTLTSCFNGVRSYVGRDARFCDHTSSIYSVAVADWVSNENKLPTKSAMRPL